MRWMRSRGRNGLAKIGKPLVEEHSMPREKPHAPSVPVTPPSSPKVKEKKPVKVSLLPSVEERQAMWNQIYEEIIVKWGLAQMIEAALDEMKQRRYRKH